MVLHNVGGPLGPKGETGPTAKATIGKKINRQSICLCMIMKNEAGIILKCLESVAPYIDYWVINDNGSTDKTVKVVEDFFKEKAIPGSLLLDPWIGFAHNRSIVFKEAEAKSKCDWMYVIDADDHLITPLYIPDKPADSDSFIINIQEGPNVMQTRQQLFKVGLSWGYAAIVHEFPFSRKIPGNKLKISKTTEIMVQASRGGDRSKDPLKYWKDAILMEKDLERLRATHINKLPHWEKGLEQRYLYYICQSWHDFGHYDNCIKWADLKIKSIKGFKEEVFRAYLLKARCLRYLHKPHEDIVKALNECIKYDKYRAEGYFELVNEYEVLNKWKEADELIKRVVKIKRPGDKLFIVEDYTYKFGAKKEAAWIAYKLENYEESYKIAHKLAEDVTNQEDHRVWAANIKYRNVEHILPSRLEYRDSIKGFKANGGDKVVVNFSISSFEKGKNTITSWLNCCQDKYDVDQWCYKSSSPIHELEELFPFLQHSTPSNGAKKGQITIHIDDGWVFFHRDKYIDELLQIKDVKILYLNQNVEMFCQTTQPLVQKGNVKLIEMKTVVKAPYCVFEQGQGIYSFERLCCIKESAIENIKNK